ncbi:uncharacterized protein EI97DRAFT_17828 [Westerdykella ornata]|uniref:F-box domain-containing protein n=1 Tax=Westerdykella ornata TaxID=318751 RepID=A0A6A6JX61_WESOR|nr:uncharacterized protein EI97DRAFT_17828 [Westerdykella ornata]KAF2280997.1 hypothetical protein EI97DRAFT_17828 [Westerdykella ornata]
MQRHHSEDEEPLEDTTTAIPLRSKRTERLQRKRAIRDMRLREQANLAQLPTELILAVLEDLRPSEVFNFSFVNRRFHKLVQTNGNALGDEIIRRRYNILTRCFPLPVLLSTIEPSVRPLLTDPLRLLRLGLGIHHNQYQHVHYPDPELVCTCLTCVLTWNNLGLVLDFAHWQNHLDNGSPIPSLPEGRKVDWNEELIARHARLVRKALGESLWYARILEIHLSSIVRSIRRHRENKGNKRKHVDMTEEDAASGTDHFLSKEGPVTLEFPFNRDEYYMLEAYVPNRWWKRSDQRWYYTLTGQHEADLAMVVRWAHL